MRIACSGPHSRAMTCSARSCHAVTPPAVMTPSASVAEDEDGGGVEGHLRVLGPEQVGIGPVPGARSAVEQARLGQQQRARADRGDQRPAACTLAKPVGFSGEAISQGRS